jgi:hypothetical protein
MPGIDEQRALIHSREMGPASLPNCAINSIELCLFQALNASAAAIELDRQLTRDRAAVPWGSLVRAPRLRGRAARSADHSFVALKVGSDLATGDRAPSCRIDERRCMRLGNRAHKPQLYAGVVLAA